MKLEEFLKPTQDELFQKLSGMYAGAVGVVDSFILVQGEAPIMLVAHLDTVHKEPVRDICTSADGNILMSPQGIGGDDRCGIYALVKSYEQSAIKPYLLFTCDEESGGIGAKTFVKCLEQLPELKKLKLLVEIDRKGSNDAVYYDCDNPDFEAYITSKGFVTDYGTFSDISVIAPALGIAAVNLSSGYYNAHQLHEYINRAELETTITKVKEIVEELARPDFPRYEYVEAYYGYYDSWGYDDFEEPEELPSEYEQLYRELLEKYTEEELEYMRGVYGNQIIMDMYLEEQEK